MSRAKSNILFSSPEQNNGATTMPNTEGVMDCPRKIISAVKRLSLLGIHQPLLAINRARRAPMQAAFSTCLQCVHHSHSSPTHHALGHPPHAPTRTPPLALTQSQGGRHAVIFSERLQKIQCVDKGASRERGDTSAAFASQKEMHDASLIAHRPQNMSCTCRHCHE